MYTGVSLNDHFYFEASVVCFCKLRISVTHKKAHRQVWRASFEKGANKSPEKQTGFTHQRMLIITRGKEQNSLSHHGEISVQLHHCLNQRHSKNLKTWCCCFYLTVFGHVHHPRLCRRQSFVLLTRRHFNLSICPYSNSNNSCFKTLTIIGATVSNMKAAATRAEW